MKNVLTSLLAILCFAVPTVTHADTILFNAAFTTSGTFSCSKAIACLGNGTNTLMLGEGDHQATLTFSGVDTALDITNGVSPVTLGTFEIVATPGFVFPPHFANPGELPVVFFSLVLAQSSPLAGTGRLFWGLGPGGGPDLPLKKGNGYMTVRTGMERYPEMVYTIHPFPVVIRANTSTALTAQVGAVPEPATLLLLGGGLAGGLLARRRRAAQKPDRP